MTTTIHNIIVGKLWIDQVNIRCAFSAPASNITHQACLSHPHTCAVVRLKAKGVSYMLKGEHTSFIKDSEECFTDRPPQIRDGLSSVT